MKTGSPEMRLFCLFNKILNVFQYGRITESLEIQLNGNGKLFFLDPDESRLKYLNFGIFDNGKLFLRASYINTNAS